MTKIASNEPTTITKRDLAGVEQTVANVRYHEAAGKQWKFTREDEDGPLVCDVTDNAAVEIFLSERNSNTFYALNPSELKRAGASDEADEGKPGKKAK